MKRSLHHKSKPKERKTPLQQQFGQLVKTRRLLLNLSQETLAEKAGLHFTYVSSTERGERNISLANKEKFANAS